MNVTPLTQTQLAWLDFVLKYETWENDNEPHHFYTNEEGNIVWLKKLRGQYTVRVSETRCSLYSKPNGINLVDEWYFNEYKDPKVSGLVVILNEQERKLMADRDRRAREANAN